jgi:fructuronate reductase
MQDRVAFFTGFAPVFGELGSEPRFVAAVARHLGTLEADGVRGALAAVGADAPA